MAQIPEHLIDRIRDSIDIVDVISRYVSLKKTGRNFKGLCPFHTEKTPSFTVSEEKQIFYCFGCGTGGNVFTFLMRYEKITFIEAARKIAEESGIELPSSPQDTQQSSEYDRLYRANQFASDHFQAVLNEHFADIKEYIQSRSINQESLNFFKIGYVQNRWDSLFLRITSQKMKLEPFLKTGLLLQSEKDSSRKYDRFRDRLMFPIHNLSGRIVAFGGRALSDDPQSPKYLNSPESPIYKKSQILYGLYFAKDWIRQEGYVIFVEGYMDFLQLFQNGIKNVTATSGTALTEDHAKLIRRYTSDIILCYDADSAGINAAIRGGQILFQNNLNVRVLILPEAEDPDSYVRKNGASAFLSLLKNAEDYFEFKMERLLRNIEKGNIPRRTTVVNEMLDSLAAHSDPLKQNFYLNVLAEKFGLQESTLLSEIQKKQKIFKSREVRIAERRDVPEIEKVAGYGFTGAWSAERDIINLLLSHLNELKNTVFNVLESDDFLNPGFRKIFIFIRDHQETKQKELMHLVISVSDDQQVTSMISGNQLNEIKNPAQYLNDCLQRVKEMRFQSRIDFLRERFKKLTPEDDDYLSTLQELNFNMTQVQKIRKLFNEK